MNTFKAYIVLLLLIINTSCTDKNLNKNPNSIDGSTIEVIQKDNGLSLQWGDMERLSGGIPLFENKDLTLMSIQHLSSNHGAEFAFTYENEEIPVKIHINSPLGNDTAILSISPNGMQSTRGEDYIGLFFEQFPHYQKGIGSYMFGDWESWTKPIQIEDIKTTQSEKILFFLFQYSDGAYGAMMPLGGMGYNATLGSQKNKFGARSVCYKDYFNTSNVPLIALAFGTDPYETVTNLYEAGMKSMNMEHGLRKNKTYPEVFESIGWCTWNALGENVSQDRIANALKTFDDNQFRIPFLLIDDGWLTIDNYKRLESYDFDKDKFPNGFKESVGTLKKEYGIKDVGVWHTMNGYWSGIAKSGVFNKNNSSLMPYFDKEDVHQDTLSGMTYYTPKAISNEGATFYDSWYKYLKEQGISFVKVDQQSVIKRVAKGQINKKQSIPFWDIAQNMQNNLQSSIKKHFGGAVINCQDMATENFYNFTSSAIGRNSDDFFPERTAYLSLEVEKGNAAAHVLMNFHNSLWFSNLVWPDFDMFQSHHIDGEYHAISRAISGGPIYLTDEPGKQNFDILNQLVLKNGRILRTDVPALPTADCLFQVNETRAYKAFSTVGKSGILGIWNTVDQDLVSTTFGPTDIHSIEGEQFAVYDYFAKTVKVMAKQDKMEVSLGRMGYQLYSIVPMEHQMAVIGLVNKYISKKTVLKSSLSKDSLKVTLAEEGQFGALLPNVPESVQVNGKDASANQWTYSNGLLLLDIEKTEGVETPTVKIEL